MVRFVKIASGGARADSDLADFPKNIAVLAIGGNIWGTRSDWQVPLASVQHFAKTVPQTKLITITGSPLTAYHSALHQNPQVDRDIAQFLFH